MKSESDTMPINICEWIRDNIPKSKLLQAKEFLSLYSDESRIVEHVYRGIKNSIKIRYAYEETTLFAGWLIYLLTPDMPEPDFKNIEFRSGFLSNFFMQNKEANSKVEKKGNSYYLFDKATLTWLGGNLMFYHILTSVVYVIEKSLANKKYKISVFINWQEAIASYVIFEFASKRSTDLSVI